MTTPGRWSRYACAWMECPSRSSWRAARVGALSPAQIADRLGDSLAVLTAGSRSALDRQQTLRATLNWSHELLPREEAFQFRRLALFAGTFSLEGAEAVTAGDCVSDAEVA